MQPKLTAKAVCANKEVGKISKVIVDPLSHQISHIIVQELNGHGAQRQIPIDQIQEVVTVMFFDIVVSFPLHLR